MSQLTKEEILEREAALKRLVKLQKELAEAGKELSIVQQRELVTAQATLENFKQQTEAAKRQLRILEKKLNLHETETDQSKKLSEAQVESINNEIKKKKELIELDRTRGATIERLAQRNSEIAENLGNKLRAVATSRAADNRRALEEATKTALAEGRVFEKAVSELTLKDTAQSLATAGAEALGIIESAARNPQLLLLNMFDGFGASLQNLQQEIKRLPAEMERNITDMVKSTGLGIEELGDTFVDALDPEYAQRMGIAFDEAATPMANIGLKSRDVKGAMDSLMQSTRLFRPEFMRTEKAAAAFITNTVAGLSKLGVKTGTSAKVIDTLTKAMRVTPKEATRSLGSITNIADSLGLSMGQVMDDFQALTGDLSQFGDRMTEVFADLQAQAQATGVSVGRLAQFAEGLDTFDNAAKAAQSLNAVLGQSAIAVTDLVHADPADKIAMIQDAIAGAGIDFENADRRMKKVIATAAGFANVEEASRILLNKEEAEESAKAVDTSQMKQDEFTKRIKDSMTTAEKMTQMTNKMAGGMKKVLTTIRPAAEEFSQGVGDSFSTMAKETQNSTVAIVELLGMLKVAEGTSDFIKEIGADTLEVIKSRNPVLGTIIEGGIDLISGPAKGVATLGAVGLAEKEAEKEGRITGPKVRGDIDLEIPLRGSAAEEAGDEAKADTPKEVQVVKVFLDGKSIGGGVANVVVEQIGATADAGLLSSMAG